MEYYEPRRPCDATQIGRFRRMLGEAGVELLLKMTIEAAVGMKAIKPAEFERVIVDCRRNLRADAGLRIPAQRHRQEQEVDRRGAR